jgi:chemotaxis protein MotB
LLVTLATQLGKLPNKISIEGHTDSKPYATSGNYSNWELSTDRANAARRLMQANGVGTSQISQVRGFADQRLRKPDNPLDSSNRRISLIVQYVPKATDDVKDAKPSATGEEKKPEENKPEEKTSAKPSAGVEEKKPEGKNPTPAPEHPDKKE